MKSKSVFRFLLNAISFVGLDKVATRAWLKGKLSLDSTLKEQLANPLSIPVVIINFNQLFYLRKLIDFLVERKHTNIVVIDNQSTYPPLLDYYKSIQDMDNITIEKQDTNAGYEVFFKSPSLIKKYGRGFYILTDADITPNPSLPQDYVAVMLKYLIEYAHEVTKVGFALRIDNIPDHYPLKSEVLKWEQTFWNENIKEELYRADLDTTFAIYKPSSKMNKLIGYYSAIRIAGSFTAEHGGWYLDKNNLTEENRYYMNLSNSSSSWKFDQDGKPLNEKYNLKS